MNGEGIGLPSEETWRKEIAMKREFFGWRALLPVLIAAIFVLFLAGSGATAEHPKADHPKSEHPKSKKPKSEQPAEHSKPEKPKSEHPTEHPKPEKPKSDHPTEHPK
jgi:cell division protein FtsN